MMTKKKLQGIIGTGVFVLGLLMQQAGYAWSEATAAEVTSVLMQLGGLLLALFADKPNLPKGPPDMPVTVFALGTLLLALPVLSMSLGGCQTLDRLTGSETGKAVVKIAIKAVAYEALESYPEMRPLVSELANLLMNPAEELSSDAVERRLRTWVDAQEVEALERAVLGELATVASAGYRDVWEAHSGVIRESEAAAVLAFIGAGIADATQLVPDRGAEQMNVGNVEVVLE